MSARVSAGCEISPKNLTHSSCLPAQAPGRGVRAESRLGCAARSAVEGDDLQGPAGPVAAGGHGAAAGTAGPVPAGRGQVMSPRTASRRPHHGTESLSHPVGEERQGTDGEIFPSFCLQSSRYLRSPGVRPSVPSAGTPSSSGGSPGGVWTVRA